MFSSYVVFYLFAGGAGGGACIVLACMGLLIPRDNVRAVASSHRRRTTDDISIARKYRALFLPAYGAAILLLALGVTCLTLDLGRPDRLFLLMVSAQLTPIVIGAWAIALTFVLTVVLTVILSGVIRLGYVGVRILFWAQLATAFVVVLYTGILLSSIDAVPLWNSPWLVVLFGLSALSCGLSVVVAMAQFSGVALDFFGVLCGLVKADVVVVALEAVALVMLLVSVYAASGTSDNTQVAAASSLAELMTGSSAWIFWTLFVTVGLVFPLLMDVTCAFRGLAAPSLSLSTAACVLVGSAAMRWCFIEAGSHPLLTVLGVS